ncbi:MAG: chromosome segregation protein SMC [Lachnospiraceae bacterium]
MYLKSIEVHGFKSFANKIVFEFKDGITGIVGPNGSGKSNVADAVRWVLGEQSAKQLRGASMQDVIFAGTQNRKPMGYAYVAITLDNKDHSLPIEYDEVTVSRRVYRSGESEYMINGTSCRLKDINALFFDTGIGKEGYSIIGQGQIEKILSGKPEERRELFDEAAGIVKFKKNKAATEKSLEQEHQNLLRVKDILDQLELQVGPLKHQSEVAKQYLEYRDECKSLDVNVFLLESDRIKGVEKELEEKIAIVTNDLDQAQKEYDLTKKEYESLELEMEHREALMEQLKNDISEAKLSKGKLEGEIKVVEEQINTAKSQEIHVQERLTRLEQSINAKNKEEEAVLEEKESLLEEREKTSQALLSLENKLESCNQNQNALAAKIEENKSSMISFMNQNTEITGKLERYDALLEQISIRKTELNQRLLTNESAKQEHESVVSRMSEAKAENDAAIEQLETETTANEAVLQKATEELNEKRSLLAEAQQDYHTSQSKLDTVRNMTERYEGYGNSIRRVMEQKEKNKGVKGVVADLIQTQKEYEVAVETALGGSIQNIVTDNENTAKQMIQYLKENKYGRATFLPLTSISGGAGIRHEQALKENGVIGRASDLVQTELEFQQVAEYLLGRILVVDHIDHAIAIAKKYRYSLHIVTLEGEHLNPGGAMSGGAFRNNSNLLGRRRELEELTEKIAKLKQQIEIYRARMDELQAEQEHAQGLAKEHNQRRQDLFLQRNTIMLNLNQAQEALTTLQQGLAGLKRENTDLDKQIAEIHKEKESLITNEKDSSKARETCEEAISELELRLQEGNQEKADLEQDYAQTRMLLAELVQKETFATSNLNRIQSEKQTLVEERKQILDHGDDAKGKVHQLLDQIAAMQEEAEQASRRVADKTKQLQEKQQEKENSAREHKTFFSKREELNETMSALDKESFRLTGQLERIQDQIQTLESYMWEEYELTYKRAEEFKDPEKTDLPSLKKELASIKSKIRALGNVNVNAIEDYKVISEKYEFLSAQRDDILKAEANLNKILHNLDVEMRKQFKERFTEIQIMFDKVFKELFGGGKATLELVEDEDLIEAGIIINAQPPGKKLQNMMQLSGGEKALTAIAILFAIQSLKPSPFCLLDEIEAALDESNVGRFAEYLHNLTKDTQFICITHRRGTMTAADVLYGITMQEKGVSTLVSVNLIEDKLDE